MNKSKKKLKGMTLIEMIISIFIFALMGGLLILIGTHIDATSKATNNLKNKVVVESPYAANRIKEVGVDPDSGETVTLPMEEMDISVKIHASGKYWVNELADPNNPSSFKAVEHSYGDANGDVVVDMKAKKYSTEALITDDMTAEQIAEMQQKANGKLNLDFFEIKPTDPPVETPPVGAT